MPVKLPAGTQTNYSVIKDGKVCVYINWTVRKPELLVYINTRKFKGLTSEIFFS